MCCAATSARKERRRTRETTPVTAAGRLHRAALISEQAVPVACFDTRGALWYNSLTSGCSAARQRASFGTMRSQVQILSPRPAIHCRTEGALCGSFFAPVGHRQTQLGKRGNQRGLPLLL